MKDLTNENVIHVRKDGIEFLQFRKLLEYSDVINHAYSIGLDKEFSVISLTKNNYNKKKKDKVIKNYMDLSDAIESDYTHIVNCMQMHTNEVKCIK